MSVVNKMLQDLEARQSDEVPSSADYQPPKKQRTKNGLWLGLLLILMVSMILLWLKDDIIAALGTTQPKDSATSISTVETLSEPNEAVDVQDTSAPVQVVESKHSTEFPQEAYEQTAQAPQLSAAVESEFKAQSDKTAEQQDAVSGDGLANEPTQDKQPATFSMATSQAANSLEGLKQQIQGALSSGDDDRARELLRTLLQRTPDNINARKKLASMLFANDDMSGAENLLLEGIELTPHNTEFRLMLARLYAQAKNLPKAYEAMADVQVNPQQQPDFLSYRASLAQQLEYFHKAKPDYLSLLELQPENSRWWLGLAVVEERLNNNAQALSAYLQMQKLEPISLDVTQFVEQRIRYLVEAQ